MRQYLTQVAQIVNKDELNVPKGELSTNHLQEALQIALGIFAAVAVLIIAISAFRIIISRGNSQDVSKARDAIIYASIGLVICMTAFFIVGFVVGRV